MARGEYLGEFEQVVLLAVARLDGDGYGMSIRREIAERGGRDVAIGAVYATVERLEDKGYVRRHDPPRGADRDARARHFFRITPTGVQALQAADALQARMWAGLRLKRVGRP